MVKKRKPIQMTVGKKYWEGVDRHYTLFQVTNIHGGVTKLSPPNLSKREAEIFAQGYNSRVGKGKGKIGFP